MLIEAVELRIRVELEARYTGGIVFTADYKLLFKGTTLVYTEPYIHTLATTNPNTNVNPPT